MPRTVPGVELSTTRLSAGFGQPALDYHLPTSSSTRSGRRDSNPRNRAPTTMPTRKRVPRRCPAGCRCPTSRHPVRTGGFEPPISWSPTHCAGTRRDNQASPRSATSSPCGSRTRLPGLRGRRPWPIDEQAIKARTFHAVGRAVLESASPGFQPGAIPSQLPTQTKKAWCRRDTRLWVFFGKKVRPDVTSARDKTGASSPNDRRRYPFQFAVRNSAVLKSWFFLGNGQFDENCLHVFYRLDAAEAEMVHGKL